MASSVSATNSRLSVDDWVQEGFRVLAEDGVKALILGEWARSESMVAAAVRASDQKVIAAVRRAFLDAGFDHEQAEMRATATFAAGIGFLHLSGSRPSPLAAGRREDFLEVMLRHGLPIDRDGLAQRLRVQQTVLWFGPEVGVDRVTGQPALQ